MSFLLSVMRFIGSLYAPNVASDPLEDQVKLAMAQPQPWTSGFEIQALLLYSIAVYWCDDLAKSDQLLEASILKAVAVGMNTKSYAVDNSRGDPVLAESWRRTWWQIYMTDLHIAASNHKTDHYISRHNISQPVDLPCEEEEYSSGHIPVPKTVEDYDNREFALDEDAYFSSFAYLIGLSRSLDNSIFGISRTSEANIKAICTNTDASNAAWVSLLSKSKQKLCKENGQVDELLFKASTLLQAYTIDIHRQLSNLKYDSIENISSCAPRPPPERLGATYQREAPIHTAKILCAIEKMTDLLTLSSEVSLHTPFTICMVATITIAHLSACKFVLKGRQLDIARERIRVAMGALETFGQVWPRGKKVLREVKTIAREILLLGPENKAVAVEEYGSPAVETIARLLDEGSNVDVDYFLAHDYTQYLDLTSGNIGLQSSCF